MIERLQPFVGEWTLDARFDPPLEPVLPGNAVMSFEWMTGAQLLVQRWEIPVREAPDGIAILGPDPDDPDGFLQHYFDSRGVVRVYHMTFDGRVWTLRRDAADFSPLDFRQRFTGTFSDDMRTIDGAW
ncbi:MAG: hypothetical protein Q8K58_10910 [Acidimicrobiales bacterium]|nr:hypothetical protein [Acidimicrobiales bacterium]